MGDNPSVVIAVDLIFLYLIMGPLVLAGVYVLFDYFVQAEKKGRKIEENRQDRDPAFWTKKDVWHNF